MRFAAVLVVAVFAIAGCGGSAPRPKPVRAQGLPGRVVEADGHKVYFDCEGKGSPTVVFISGWGDDSSSWATVFDQSARVTRSCEYDRYGLALTSNYGSMPRKARDANDQARELDQLLENARIAKPYVLVGHSWGGALARLYAGDHDDVKAVVFVDSATPGQIQALAAALPPRRSNESPLLSELRNTPAQVAHPLENPEYLDWRKSLDEVGGVTTLNDRPEIVLTAGNTFTGDAHPLFSAWRRLQDKLAQLSPHSVHVLVPDSGHYIQQQAPDVVLASIRAAVNSVRDRKLPSCAAIFGSLPDARCLEGGH
jgi:pimeloyl-ACP methyl ester carboxylesterase